MAGLTAEKRPIAASPLRDLPWFAAQVFRTAPLPIAAWTLLSLISAAASAAGLWAMRGAVNALVGYGAATQRFSLTAWLVTLGLLFAMEQAVMILQPYMRERVRVVAGFALQTAALRKMGRLPVAAFDVEPTHDLVRRVADGADSRVPGLVEDALGMLELLPMVVANAVVLGLISPWLPVLIALAEALLLWHGARIGARARQFEVEQTRQRRLADYYAGLLTARAPAAEVRLWGVGGELLNRWRTTLTNYLNGKLMVSLKNSLRGAGSSLGFAVLVASAPVAVTLLGGRVEPGIAALVLTAIRSVTAGMNMILRSIRSFTEQAGFASDLRHLEQQLQPEEPEGPVAGPGFPQPLRGGIRVEHLSYRYPGAEGDALSDLTFELKAGEVVALVGANGAGKTTLASLLVGLRTPTAGAVCVDGTDLSAISPSVVRRACTAVFQQPVRLPGSVRENVAFAAAAGADAALAGVQERVGIGRGALEPDLLLGPEFGGVDLSGGEWQQLAIARALFRTDAQVVVFDEPTAALDPLAELALFERFADLAAGRTTILVSHRLGPTRLADRVLVLDGGRLVEQGPPAQLLAANGRFAQMFAAQAEWYR